MADGSAAITGSSCVGKLQFLWHSDIGANELLPVAFYEKKEKIVLFLQL